MTKQPLSQAVFPPFFGCVPKIEAISQNEVSLPAHPCRELGIREAGRSFCHSPAPQTVLIEPGEHFSDKASQQVSFGKESSNSREIREKSFPMSWGCSRQEEQVAAPATRASPTATSTPGSWENVAGSSSRLKVAAWRAVLCLCLMDSKLIAQNLGQHLLNDTVKNLPFAFRIIL